MAKILRKSVAIVAEPSDNSYMAIDRFNQARFEAALPRTAQDGTQLARWRRFEGGQFIYRYGVSANVFINIYSSIDESGFARECAEDSIKFLLVDATGALLSNKLQKYVTRVHGWENRVVEMFWRVYAMARMIAAFCERCNEQRKIFMTKKDEPYQKDGKWFTNKGRLFVKCPRCGKFEWVTEPKEVKKAA